MRRTAVVIAILCALVLPLPVAAQQNQGAQAGGVGAAGQTSTAIPVPRPPESRDITLVEQTTFAWPGSVVSLRVRLAEITPASRLEVAIHRAATSRTQFGQTLEGTNLGSAQQTFADLDPAGLPSDGDGGVRLTFGVADDDDPPTPATLVLANPGVYPVSLTLRTPGRDDEVLVTHLVRMVTDDEGTERLASDTSTFDVGLLVELAAPTTVDPSGAVSISASSAANLGAVAGVLAGRDQPTTLLARPATMTALAQRDATAGTDVVGAVALAASRGQILGATWAPVAAGSLLTSGLLPYLDRQITDGAQTLDRLLNRSTRPDGNPAGVDGSGLWFLDRSVDPDALSALRAAGVTSVIVPEALVEPLDTQRFPVTLTQPFLLVANAGGTDDGDTDLPALQTDEVTGSLLSSSSQAALAANRVLADLAMLAFDLPDVRRGVVVQVQGASPVAGALDQLLAGLAQAAAPPAGTRPLLTAAPVGDIFERAEPAGLSSGTRAPSALERTWVWDEPVELGTFPNRLADTDALAAAMSSTVLSAAPPPAPEAESSVAAVDHAILAAGTAGYDEAQRQQQLDVADTLIRAALAPIGVPAQGTVTLTADEGVVPVVIENGRADPVRVVLELVSDKLDFPDGNTFDLVLEPGSNRIETAVRTRATGAFPIELEVRTAEGDVTIANGRFTVRSTAVSGLGLGLSVVAGLFLAAWWARNLRSTRRRQQLIGQE
jgi:hypothetical protein